LGSTSAINRLRRLVKFTVPRLGEDLIDDEPGPEG
jgi:hypothetical protein